MPRRFEFSSGTSNKFWEVSVEDRAITVRFGRIGSQGQSRTKRLADATAAKLAMAKLIGEKQREGYREVSGKAPPPQPSVTQAIAALDAKLAKTVQPYVRVVDKPRKSKLPLWASKACDGRPYLPKTEPWPKVKGGGALRPVLQIDFADVPALPNFPRAGLLSLWWTEDHQRQVLAYYPKVLRDEAKLWTDFSQVPDDTLYPYKQPVALTFEKRTGCICWGDFRFKQLVGDDALYDSPHYDKLFDHVWSASGGADTRMGGWANPQQEDPRTSKRASAYETQLLQIQNDNFTHNLFVKPADLKRADFSDVLFYDACD